MTPKHREAMLDALYVIEAWGRGGFADEYWSEIEDSITALRDALSEQVLAEPVQEPVADITAAMVMELRDKTDAPLMECKKALSEADGDMVKAEKILRNPPHRKPLSDEEIQEAVTKAVRERKLSWMGFSKDEQGQYTIPVLSPYHYELVRVIEAKLKEKNT